MLNYLAIIALACAYTSAEYLYGDNPYNYVSEYASAYDNYKPKDYKFEYGVSDPHTGDHKSQWEVKENGIVRGAYSLLEADGTTRLVEYYADDTGFHADVKKIGTAVHPPTPVEHHAPLYSAHGSTYGYGDIAQFTGYGTSGLAVNYAHTPAASHQVVAVPPVAQPKAIIEPATIAVQQPLYELPIAPTVLYQQEPKLPTVVIPEQPPVLYRERPALLYGPEQQPYPAPIQYQPSLYHHQPSAHAQAFATVLLEKQAAAPVPVQYTKQLQYEVPQQYELPQPVQYVPDRINHAVPQQIRYEAPIAIKAPQQKNVVIYENQVPQHQYVNYAADMHRAYYEKPLPYAYDDAAPQYYHGSY